MADGKQGSAGGDREPLGGNGIGRNRRLAGQADVQDTLLQAARLDDARTAAHGLGGGAIWQVLARKLPVREAAIRKRVGRLPLLFVEERFLLPYPPAVAEGVIERLEVWRLADGWAAARDEVA